jgi:hypothetical protein
METSASMMVMMTLTVCNPSKQDAFHGRQALGHITSHHIASHRITSHHIAACRGLMKHPSSGRSLAT